MFAEHEISHVVSSEHQSPKPWTLTVYRGLGGDHIVIDPVETVYDLLNAVDQRTDWLWGFCSPHAIRKSYSDDFLPWDHLLFWIRDMDSGEILALNCGLSITTSSNIQIVYRPLRITREGFPCFNCMEFVFWKSPCWFTRYRLKYPEYYTAPERGWMSPSLVIDYVRTLLHPRDYFCEECGPFIDDEYSDEHLETVSWNSATSTYAYKWTYP